MVEACDMRDKSKNIFKNYLVNNVDNLSPDNITNKSITENQKEWNKIKTMAEKEECDLCLNEVTSLYNNYLELIESIRSYELNDNKKLDFINEEYLLNDILEPINNKPRLQILKEIVKKLKSFSALFELTGLKGGNIRFYLQKLQDSNLIFQKQERSEYMLSTRGFNIMKNLIDMENNLKK